MSSLPISFSSRKNKEQNTNQPKYDTNYSNKIKSKQTNYPSSSTSFSSSSSTSSSLPSSSSFNFTSNASNKQAIRKAKLLDDSKFGSVRAILTQYEEECGDEFQSAPFFSSRSMKRNQQNENLFQNQSNLSSLSNFIDSNDDELFTNKIFLTDSSLSNQIGLKILKAYGYNEKELPGIKKRIEEKQANIKREEKNEENEEEEFFLTIKKNLSSNLTDKLLLNEINTEVILPNLSSNQYGVGYEEEEDFDEEEEEREIYERLDNGEVEEDNVEYKRRRNDLERREDEDDDESNRKLLKEMKKLKKNFLLSANNDSDEDIAYNDEKKSSSASSSAPILPTSTASSSKFFNLFEAEEQEEKKQQQNKLRLQAIEERKKQLREKHRYNISNISSTTPSYSISSVNYDQYHKEISLVDKNAKISSESSSKSTILEDNLKDWLEQNKISSLLNKNKIDPYCFLNFKRKEKKEEKKYIFHLLPNVPLNFIPSSFIKPTSSISESSSTSHSSSSLPISSSTETTPSKKSVFDYFKPKDKERLLEIAARLREELNQKRKKLTEEYVKQENEEKISKIQIKEENNYSNIKIKEEKLLNNNISQTSTSSLPLPPERSFLVSEDVRNSKFLELKKLLAKKFSSSSSTTSSTSNLPTSSTSNVRLSSTRTTQSWTPSPLLLKRFHIKKSKYQQELDEAREKEKLHDQNVNPTLSYLQNLVDTTASLPNKIENDEEFSTIFTSSNVSYDELKKIFNPIIDEKQTEESEDEIRIIKQDKKSERDFHTVEKDEEQEDEITSLKFIPSSSRLKSQTNRNRIKKDNKNKWKNLITHLDEDDDEDEA